MGATSAGKRPFEWSEPRNPKARAPEYEAGQKNYEVSGVSTPANEAALRLSARTKNGADREVRAVL